MKLYRVNDNYLNYLRNVDCRVPQIKPGNVRPFVGVVLSINGISYFAPLSSQKKNNRPDFKVSQGGKQIATVRTAFMLPIPECAITEIDLASERSKDPKYTSLLINEINFIKQAENKAKLLGIALKTYEYAMTKRFGYDRFCIDFLKLEEAMRSYPNHTS